MKARDVRDALVDLRLGHRRTLSHWTAIDFAAAVALGAIIGRTTVAEGQSVAIGAAALVTIPVAHYVVAVGRFHPRIATLVRPPRARAGRPRPAPARPASPLRTDGRRSSHSSASSTIGSVSQLPYVLHETKG